MPLKSEFMGKAYGALKSELGRRARREGWGIALHDFIAEQGVWPDTHQQDQLRAHAAENEAASRNGPPYSVMPTPAKLNVSKGSPMALSKTFPAMRATRSLIPITARELVEWTYAVQRAQGVREPSLKPQGRSQAGAVVDRMIEFAHLGCRVDVSSSAAAIWGEARCDEDAILVHEIVQAMQVKKRALLIQHGLQRSVPEWNPLVLPLRCVPVKGRQGAYKGIYSDGHKGAIGTVVTYQGDWPDRETAARARAHWPQGEPHLRCAQEVIEYARAVYSDWIKGLMVVEGWRLRRYVVRGLGAATHPWICDFSKVDEYAT